MADEDIRKLEREARMGDVDAAARLRRRRDRLRGVVTAEWAALVPLHQAVRMAENRNTLAGVIGKLTGRRPPRKTDFRCAEALLLGRPDVSAEVARRQAEVNACLRRPIEPPTCEGPHSTDDPCDLCDETADV